MVHLRAVVQGERVIARAPAIAHARKSVHDERVYADPAERGGDRQASLPAADDQHGGLAVLVALIRVALLLPVRAAEIARIGFTGRPPLADLLLESLELVQAGHDLERLRRVAREQPDDTEAAADLRLELEDSFDDVGAGPVDATRRRAAFGHGKATRFRRRLLRHHQRGDLVGALLRRDRPGEGEQIAPVTFRRKQCRDGFAALALQCDIELTQPLLDELPLPSGRQPSRQAIDLQCSSLPSSLTGGEL